ncbi:putative radical SAM protein [Bordetella avium 197N]|uniref:Radical SAM protein n=1 Tax=Bordetella avium (strain 197N) TaxID=360910 RepID=Q2L2Q5_BORA1|nr:putative radical SAM protein [Bordetella avium 197N]
MRTEHSLSAGFGSPATAPAASRGRGAVTNVRHRFEQTEREVFDDGWFDGEAVDDASPDDVYIESEEAYSDEAVPDVAISDEVGPDEAGSPRFPQDGVASEESGLCRVDQGHVWGIHGVSARSAGRNIGLNTGFNTGLNTGRHTGCDEPKPGVSRAAAQELGSQAASAIRAQSPAAPASLSVGLSTAATQRHIPVLAVPRTSVKAEQARKMLARNDSPDIPFDVAVNPYRGCEHGCVYCYARPTHAYLGYSPGLDFETRLVAKANAVQALRAELARPGYKVAPINFGSATDIYQPVERTWRLTRGLLELMAETHHPLTLVTKSALIERDLDLLAALAREQLLTVHISISTLDPDMARTLEPRATAPSRRLETLRKLAQAGVPVGVLVAPVIPFINDDSLEQILEAAAEAGATSAGYTVVRLPWEVKEVFETWLHTHFPDRAQRVLHRIEDMREGRRNDSSFETRMHGTDIWGDLLRQRFQLTTRHLGLAGRSAELALDRFQPPVVVSASRRRRGAEAAREAGQMALFQD